MATRRRRATTATALLALAVTLALVPPTGVTAAALPACTRTWAGGTGQWADAAKWSGGAVPTVTDHVCVTAAGSRVEVRATEATIASLQVGGASGTVGLAIVPEVAGTVAAVFATTGIVVGANATVTLGSPQTVGGIAKLGVPGAPTTPGGPTPEVQSAGTIAVVPGEAAYTAVVEGRLVSAGSVRVEAPATVATELVSDGDLLVAAPLYAERLSTRAGTLAGAQRVTTRHLTLGDAASRGPLPEEWPLLDVIAGGTVTVTGGGAARVETRGTVDLAGALRPRQLVSVTGQPQRPATLRFADTLVVGGTVTLRSDVGGVATLKGTGADPLVFVEATGAVVQAPAADVAGRVEADVVNLGVVATGDRPLTVTGDLHSGGTVFLGTGALGVGGMLGLRPDGTLANTIREADLRGTATAAGEVVVDGTLVTTTDGVAVPSPGATFPLLTGNSRVGTFRDHRFQGPVAYDLASTATTVTLVRRAPEATSRGFVRAAHQDLVGRQPMAPELATIAAQIDGGTLTRAALVRRLADSSEYVGALVQRYYADTLGRPGDPAGVAHWVDQLRTGRRTPAQVAASFYASPEMFARAGGTPTAWVDALYPVFFDRVPTGPDRTYWAARAQARGRSAVALELFQSLESRLQRVDRLYVDLLGRAADGAGLTYWSGRISREGDLALAVSLASSTEYARRAAVRYP